MFQSFQLLEDRETILNNNFRLHRNLRKRADVMLSASEASRIFKVYEDEILRLRLRMTLRYKLKSRGEDEGRRVWNDWNAGTA
jgi:hypothetical protein